MEEKDEYKDHLDNIIPRSEEEIICPHCKMDKKIRNPSSFCDHLYYPEYCDICKKELENMEEKKEVRDTEVVGMVVPPQSSLKLVSHGLGEKSYYTWEVKVYCDNLDFAFDDVKRLDKRLKEEYGQV